MSHIHIFAIFLRFKFLTIDFGSFLPCHHQCTTNSRNLFSLEKKAPFFDWGIFIDEHEKKKPENHMQNLFISNIILKKNTNLSKWKNEQQQQQIYGISMKWNLPWLISEPQQIMTAQWIYSKHVDTLPIVNNPEWFWCMHVYFIFLADV